MTDTLVDIVPDAIDIVIPGTPQQQGSKRHVGHGIMIEDNAKLKPWRAEAIDAAQTAYTGPKIGDPLRVEAEFYFTRPMSHYGTGRNAHQLRANAPTYYKSSPDLDKLERAVGDALTQAGTIHDDRLIVQWYAVKLYTNDAPRTLLTLHPIRTR